MTDNFFTKNANILLTKQQQQDWRFPSDTDFRVRETPEGLFLYPSDPPLTKIYIEPTSRCNLNCAACMRHSWDEPGGTMSMDTFQKVIRDLHSVKTINTMAFWGIGEPLIHTGIIEMIRMAKTLGVKTEIITNGLLLDPALSRKLILSGLDTLIVSIDGTSQASYASVRSGADLNHLIHAVKSLNTYKMMLNRRNPKIGIEFVVSKKNIDELPDLADIARQIQAAVIYISNVLPYTREAQNDLLYRISAGSSYSSRKFPDGTPEVMLPRMDKLPENLKPLAEFMVRTDAVRNIPQHPAGVDGYCPFVGKGSLAIRWDGEVSPCIPLMHSHQCFILNRQKTIRRYSVGNINRDTIGHLWEKQEFTEFRKRVMDFDFAPCSHCDCELAESNEEDCFGTPFPTCGDCLWARRIVICP